MKKCPGRGLFNFVILLVSLPFLYCCALNPQFTQPSTPASTPKVTNLPPTITPTATHFPPTITPTVNPFEIDIEKIKTMPESMQALLDNPEKYQMAPDPLGNGPENGELAFESWFDSLTYALGDPKLQPVNLLADGFSSDSGGSCCGDFLASGTYPKPGEGTYFFKGYPTQKNPYFFYFSHSGVLHPVLGVKVGTISKSYWGTVFIILDQSGWLQDDGLDTIADIYNGYRVGQGLFLMREDPEYPINDPVTIALIHCPFNWKGFETWDTDMSSRYAIGIGGFRIWDPSEH